MNFKKFLKEELSLENRIIKSLIYGENFDWNSYKFLLNEETLQDLISTMSSKYRSINKYMYKEPITINNFKTYYYAGTKSLRFYADTKSPTGKTYNTNIFIAKVDYVEEDPKDNNYTEFDIIDKSGQTFKVWYKIPLIGENPAKVHCSCPDYAWRGSRANKQHNYLSTNIPNYVKNYKPKTNRGPVNPDNIEMLCKHIYGFLQYLKRNNHIK